MDAVIESAGTMEAVINQTNVPINSTDASLDRTIAVLVDTFCILLGAISLYIFGAQLVYCIHIYKRGVKTKKCKLWSDVLLMFSAFTTLIRVGFPVRIVALDLSEEFCYAYFDCSVAAYACTYISLWTVLWMRIRNIYQSPHLKETYSACIRIVTDCIEVLVVCGVLASTIHFFVTRNFTVAKFQCIDINADQNDFIWAVDFACIFLSQAALLFLILYPLCKHKKWLRNSDLGQTKSLKLLGNAIRRATVASGFCMIINVVAIPIQYMLARKSPYVYDIPYNISLVAQLITVVAIFKNWRQRFWPWRLHRHSLEQSKIRTNETRAVNKIERSLNVFHITV